MGMAQWLLLLAVLAWSGGLARAIQAALRDIEPAAFEVPAPRPLHPAIALIAHYADRRLPARWRSRQMTRLLEAGVRGYPTPPLWFALRCCLAVAGGGMGLALAIHAGGMARLIALAGIAAGWLLPEAWLGLRIRQRRRRTGADLELCLELLLCGLDSGLSLRAALELARLSGPPGPLGEALTHTLCAVGRGEPGRIFSGLSRHVHSPAAIALVRALASATESGTRVAPATLAAISRLAAARLARAERCASQAPRRVLRPLLACAAPGLVVAMTAPAVVRLLAAY